MINTQTDVFDEKEGKKADFIAYLTNRVPYIDTSEKKYHLLTKEEVSGLIKKANAEGNDLKALELLDAAKKSFGSPAKIDSAKIVTKSLRIPGDIHLKLLARSYTQVSSDSRGVVSSVLRELIISRMESVLAELKKLKDLNKEKIEPLVQTFDTWKQSKIFTDTGDLCAVINQERNELNYWYNTKFSKHYEEIAKGNLFIHAANYLVWNRIHKGCKENGIPESAISKIRDALQIIAYPDELSWLTEEEGDVIVLTSNSLSTPDGFLTWPEITTNLDLPGPTIAQGSKLISATKDKQELTLSFFYLPFLYLNDVDALEAEIGVDSAKKLSEVIPLEKEAGDEHPVTDFCFSYSAPITITGDQILFKEKPIIEENKTWIYNEILTDMSKEFGPEMSQKFIDGVTYLKRADNKEFDTQLAKLLDAEKFEEAANLKRSIIIWKNWVFLIEGLTDSVFDVLKTSKVVTFTMPEVLNGVFEAYRSSILEPITSKKTTGEGEKQ